MSKLPPFGKSVEEKLRHKQWLNIFVFAGVEGWARARSRNYSGDDCLLLPHGENPDQYSWPVTNQSLMLVWIDGTRDEIISFGSLLIKAGAQLVVAPTTHDSEGAIFFKPEVAA